MSASMWSGPLVGGLGKPALRAVAVAACATPPPRAATATAPVATNAVMKLALRRRVFLEVGLFIDSSSCGATPAGRRSYRRLSTLGVSTMFHESFTGAADSTSGTRGAHDGVQKRWRHLCGGHGWWG